MSFGLTRDRERNSATGTESTTTSTVGFSTCFVFFIPAFKMIPHLPDL